MSKRRWRSEVDMEEEEKQKRMWRCLPIKNVGVTEMQNRIRHFKICEGNRTKPSIIPRNLGHMQFLLGLPRESRSSQ